MKLPTTANNTYSLPTMNSAANIIPDDISPFPFSACHGREIQLLRRDETRTTVHLRFRIGRLRHEVLISREHWRWVLGVVERFPVMVAHYQYEAGGPTHMIWAFPPPIGSDRGSCRYYSYSRSSDEIGNSLTEDISCSLSLTGLEAEFHRLGVECECPVIGL